MAEGRVGGDPDPAVEGAACPHQPQRLLLRRAHDQGAGDRRGSRQRAGAGRARAEQLLLYLTVTSGDNIVFDTLAEPGHRRVVIREGAVTDLDIDGRIRFESAVE